MTDQHHIQTNVVQFYSNLEPFRIAEKYTDLTIECDDSYFQCHRLTLASASQFFDSMFADTFRERKEEHLSIREVDAVTLGEVLRFIYTGDVVVTSANVCNLLKASKLFSLSGIADLCLEFVKSNRMTVNTTLTLYSLARQDTNKMLVDLLSQDIADQFKIFARASLFLEIPFNDLKIILDKLSPMENEEASLGFVFRWYFHSRKERGLNFDQLYRATNFSNVSTEVNKFVTSKLYKDEDADELKVETVDPTGYNEFVAMPRTIPFNEKKLHLFVRQTGENFIKIFSIDKLDQCEISGEVQLKDIPQSLRTLAFDNYLYCLHYVRRNSEQENNQKFRVYTSVKMDSFMELNAPPVIFGDVNLCRGRGNTIYAYNQLSLEPLVRTNSRCSVLFTDEEINRGIYLYNVDLDIWLPVPAMQTKVQDACMTSHNGILYMIGGISSINSTSAKLVQTYDCREGKWRDLPGAFYDCIGADCCVFNDESIYVCGGIKNSNLVQTYNPSTDELSYFTVAKKQMNVEMQYHRVINYNFKLWAFGGFIKDSQSVNNLSIQNYPNEITSTVACTGCTQFRSSPQNYDIDFRTIPSLFTSTNYNNSCYSYPTNYRRPIYNIADHTPHNISSSSYDNWLEKNMLEDLKNSKNAAVILDGVVF